MNHDEAVLVRKAQKGHAPSFEQLVRRYDENIMRLLCHLLNDSEDARDVYQEVFFKVYKSIASFNFRSEFYTWVYRIALNTAINFRKKRKKNWRLEGVEYFAAQNELDHIKIEDAVANPEHNFLNSELSLQIADAVDQLSPKQRAVFVLRHYEGMKLKEIAKILQLNEGTVKNYLFRALEKMRRNLHEYKYFQ